MRSVLMNYQDVVLFIYPVTVYIDLRNVVIICINYVYY